MPARSFLSMWISQPFGWSIKINIYFIIHLVQFLMEKHVKKLIILVSLTRFHLGAFWVINRFCKIFFQQKMRPSKFRLNIGTLPYLCYPYLTIPRDMQLRSQATNVLQFERACSCWPNFCRPSQLSIHYACSVVPGEQKCITIKTRRMMNKTYCAISNSSFTLQNELYRKKKNLNNKAARFRCFLDTLAFAIIPRQ